MLAGHILCYITKPLTLTGISCVVTVCARKCDEIAKRRTPGRSHGGTGRSSSWRQLPTAIATRTLRLMSETFLKPFSQKPASVMAYAAVRSDETKSSQVFIEPKVKANNAGYRENAGRKCVSVDTKILIQPISSPTSSPRTVRRLPQPLTRRHGVSHPDVWCREHLSSSITEEMRSPSNPKLNPVGFYT